MSGNRDDKRVPFGSKSTDVRGRPSGGSVDICTTNPIKNDTQVGALVSKASDITNTLSYITLMMLIGLIADLSANVYDTLLYTFLCGGISFIEIFPGIIRCKYTPDDTEIYKFSNILKFLSRGLFIIHKNYSLSSILYGTTKFLYLSSGLIQNFLGMKNITLSFKENGSNVKFSITKEKKLLMCTKNEVVEVEYDEFNKIKLIKNDLNVNYKYFNFMIDNLNGEISNIFNFLELNDLFNYVLVFELIIKSEPHIFKYKWRDDELAKLICIRLTRSNEIGEILEFNVKYLYDQFKRSLLTHNIKICDYMSFYTVNSFINKVKDIITSDMDGEGFIGDFCSKDGIVIFSVKIKPILGYYSIRTTRSVVSKYLKLALNEDEEIVYQEKTLSYEEFAADVIIRLMKGYSKIKLVHKEHVGEQICSHKCDKCSYHICQLHSGIFEECSDCSSTYPCDLHKSTLDECKSHKDVDKRIIIDCEKCSRKHCQRCIKKQLEQSKKSGKEKIFGFCSKCPHVSCDLHQNLLSNSDYYDDNGVELSSCAYKSNMCRCKSEAEACKQCKALDLIDNLEIDYLRKSFNKLKELRESYILSVDSSKPLGDQKYDIFVDFDDDFSEYGCFANDLTVEIGENAKIGGISLKDIYSSIFNEKYSPINFVKDSGDNIKEMIFICGPSGVGKTQLSNYLSTLDEYKDSVVISSHDTQKPSKNNILNAKYIILNGKTPQVCIKTLEFCLSKDGYVSKDTLRLDVHLNPKNFLIFNNINDSKLFRKIIIQRFSHEKPQYSNKSIGNVFRQDKIIINNLTRFVGKDNLYHPLSDRDYLFKNKNVKLPFNINYTKYCKYIDNIKPNVINSLREARSWKIFSNILIVGITPISNSDIPNIKFIYLNNNVVFDLPNNEYTEALHATLFYNSGKYTRKQWKQYQKLITSFVKFTKFCIFKNDAGIIGMFISDDYQSNGIHMITYLSGDISPGSASYYLKYSKDKFEGNFQYFDLPEDLILTVNNNNDNVNNNDNINNNDNVNVNARYMILYRR